MTTRKVPSNLREATAQALASLTPDEERVLRTRFGIGMNTDNVERIGTRHARQGTAEITARALRKLRSPKGSPSRHSGSPA